MIMISLTMNCPKICANADIWAKIVKFYPFFSLMFFDPFSNFVKICFLFLKNSRRFQKVFFSLIMSLSHFGENWELTFSGL